MTLLVWLGTVLATTGESVTVIQILGNVAEVLSNPRASCNSTHNIYNTALQTGKLWLAPREECSILQERNALYPSIGELAVAHCYIHGKYNDALCIPCGVHNHGRLSHDRLWFRKGVWSRCGVKSGGSEYCNDLRMDVNMILIISEQAQDCKTWHVRAWSWSQVEVPVLQAVVQL